MKLRHPATLAVRPVPLGIPPLLPEVHLVAAAVTRVAEPDRQPDELKTVTVESPFLISELQIVIVLLVQRGLNADRQDVVRPATPIDVPRTQPTLEG